MIHPRILVTEGLEPAPHAWLSDHAHVVLCPHDDPSALAGHLSVADGLVVRTYTQVDEPLLQLAPNLRVVGRGGVGLENINLEACRRRGVQVVYTPNANTQAVVEYVFALLLDALRPRPRKSIDKDTTAQEFHQFRAQLVGTELGQLTLGILGFGRIGRGVGKVAAAFGMKLLVHDLLPEPSLRSLAPFPFEFVDSARLFGESDILTLHVDGRPENRRLINDGVLDQLKPSCLLVNAARGMIVDSNALAAWARSVAGSGGGAILDVHEPEPPPVNYPLYDLPNVRLLPHLGARTRQGLENMGWVVRDVVAVLQGRQAAYPAP